MHVHPPGLKRQAHEDTLHPGPRRGETKRGAAVMNKVELDVAAAAQLLPFFLLRGEGHVFAPGDEGQVRREKGPSAVLHKAEDLLWVVFRRVEVIEEYSPDAARFFAVRDVEIFVAPTFEARVVALVVFVAGFFDGLVEMDGVFVEEIGRRQIGSAAKPSGSIVSK